MCEMIMMILMIIMKLVMVIDINGVVMIMKWWNDIEMTNWNYYY